MRRAVAVLALCFLVEALRPAAPRTRLQSTNSPDLEEEARIRAKLEDHAAQQRGRHAKKKLSPAAQRRRAKRGASFEAAQDLGRELAQRAALRRRRESRDAHGEGAAAHNLGRTCEEGSRGQGRGLRLSCEKGLRRAPNRASEK